MSTRYFGETNASSTSRQSPTRGTFDYLPFSLSLSLSLSLSPLSAAGGCAPGNARRQEDCRDFAELHRKTLLSRRRVPGATQID
jgi:hypothetical protein